MYRNIISFSRFSLLQKVRNELREKSQEPLRFTHTGDTESSEKPSSFCFHETGTRTTQNI